jgi:hypothetical protein
MLPPEKQAEQLSHELDRYLSVGSDHPQVLPSEDQPDLELGVQLLHTDFSHQSKQHARLRRNLEIEQGSLSASPANKLIKSAASRQRWILIKRNYWPVLLALVILFGVWSWSTTTPLNSTNTVLLHPSPMVIVTAALTASQQPAEVNLRPVPTPLAPPSIGAYFSSSTTPAVQHTPFGLSFPSPDVENH